MPKLSRRSGSEQLSKSLSDGDINSKSNSRWWKNLSDNTRRMSLLTNSQIHPDSYKVLNTDSTITEDQNSQWWRHLSENENVASSPSKVNLTGGKNTEDSTEKNLSESQSEEDDQIFTKKKLFASQEQRPQKSRYSKAFNLNSDKAIEEEQNAPEEKQNFEIDVFKNQLQDDNNIVSKATKGSKKRRKTKSIFSKKLGKRKYSDAFKFPEPAATEESSINKKVENEDSADVNISVTKESTVENPKEGLFKLNRKKKRYSQAFLNAVNDEPIEQITEKQEDEKKNNDNEDRSNNHNQTTETSKIVKKVSLFKGNFKRKNYSEAFAVSKSSVLQNSESSEEEINIDEIQTQKHASFISDRSVNITNKKKTPQKEIRNQNENITKSATKSKTSINQILHSEMGDSESSEEEINIEEINTQKTLEKSIKATKEKNNLFTRNTRSKKYSEAFLSQDNKENENDEHEVEETKLDPSQHVQKSQTLRKGKDDSSDEENIEEIKTQKEAVDKNINITKEVTKNLLERGTKIKISSQEFLSQDNDNKEKENYEVEETKLDPSQRTRKSQALNKDENDLSDGENIEVIKTQRDMKKTLFIRETRSKKYSEVFLGASSSKIIQEENSSHSEKENDDIDTKKVSTYRGRQDLFKLQNNRRKYSQVFEIDDGNTKNNQNEPMATEENAAMQRKESLEKLKTNNTKHSQAFMELISMQKEIEEERARNAKQINIENKYLELHTNKSVDDIVEKEIESDDTKLSSISSINIPADIKHPLFRPKARKSLYSSRSVNKNNQSNITSDQDSQKKLEQGKFRRISSKRFSLRSASPADFFEESLISSTKLIINPNEDGLEGSAKKKRGRLPKSTSTVSENIQENRENIQPEKEIISTNKSNTQYQEIENIPHDRNAEPGEAVDNKNTTESARKSKVVSKIIEDFEISISENEIQKNNKITESNEKFKKKKRGKRHSKSTIHENLANTSEKENSLVTKSRKSLTRTNENVTEANKLETEAQVHELPVEDVSDNVMTENKNEELDKLMKQKNIVSKIPKQVNREDNVTTPENNNRKSSVINKSNESSLNNTQILYSTDLDMSLNNPENSREIPVEKAIINHTLNLSTSNQKQSSRFNKERNSESKESLSNIITINSSTSRAQTSQFSGVNKNVEIWLSKSFAEPAQNVENKNAEEFLTTLNLEPRKSKKLFSWRRGSKSEQSSAEDELKREEFLLAVKDNLPEKQNKPQTEILVKKITDYFSKLDKNEKLKPIPKKTNSVKKTPHPVCTARLVNGKPYYAKKLFRGKQWCTPRLYKYLQNKMKEEYNDDTINESEKIMKYLVNSVQVVIKSKKYLKEEVENLKKELARHKIIATTYDFFCFCSDFLPTEYRDLVVPMTRLYTSEPSVPYNEKDIFKQIEY